MKREIIYSNGDRRRRGPIPWFLAFCSGVLLFSGAFLFTHLGTYALWDDEAETALGALSVWEKGDTGAKVGHNLNARRGGINLKEMADRLTPPLPTYLMAPFLGLGRPNSLYARIPFALCGFLSISLILWFLWKQGASRTTMMIFSIALLANISLFLYFRQARYYGLALSLALILIILYERGFIRTTERYLYSFLSFLLFFSHPIMFAQLQVAAFLDWIIFRRRVRGFPTGREILELTIPCLICSLPLLFIWNPFLVKSKEYLEQVSSGNRLTLLWWNFRDLFRAEFIPLISVVLAPWAYWRTRNPIILRSLLAIVAVVVTTSMLTYQPVSVTSVADVRYEIPAIWFGLGLTTCIGTTVLATVGNGLGTLLLILFLGTSLGSGNYYPAFRWESRVGQYVGELMEPIQEPYTPVIQWVAQHVPAKSSVAVFPDYMMYPLMFHAPHAVYAWQLRDISDPQFRGLPEIHFQGRVSPDYLIVFGPGGTDLLGQMEGHFQNQIHYSEVARIQVFWKDLYRPEIFWRSFSTIQVSDPSQGITVYKKSIP